ncbi:hypothetical protein ACIQWR_39670 [Streptomyces sp. NPDC098789]|uniref:hypothetical protein n=1 Tax=Streptomyces sp. NPDC098789 TaxID=3366098 RepID=UPI0038001053
MRNFIHRGRTTTVATAARGTASTPDALDPVSRFLADLGHFLMTPCPVTEDDRADAERAGRGIG